MTDLGPVSLADLRREVRRREEEEARARMDAVNAEYGPCPECGAPICGYRYEVVEEHWTAPGWEGWPADPPVHMRRRVASEWLVTLNCQRRHEWSPPTIYRTHPVG